jgi:D-3-phosphoglycerate dehydrogenase / 2-oxoglutarate reductase
VTVFRYADLPGMIGRVGTIFGAHGINISSAAVGHTPEGKPSGESAVPDGVTGESAQRSAAMVVTTDVLVPREVVEEIVASEGFLDGWAVVLS